ncbi:GNAT family N-acetyltransferase [Actinomyces faecalis]|uniref:GNAT family N-acetyltransferase n=1 Tax=Actinomyces faecalis TaxID=2722820 RepID=UPI001556463F|nr:GNAT family N-acetyltransferase [Actinomyces faecalis]
MKADRYLDEDLDGHEPVSIRTVTGDAVGPEADAVRRGAALVRLEVFVDEQDVPFVLEVDARDDDPTTVHVLASAADGTPLGTARLLTDPDSPGRLHLGRLAVRRQARGTGLGARLVAAVEQVAVERLVALDAAGRNGLEMVLSAQEQAMGFYARCGYAPVDGRRYLDAGIWHQDMARFLTR